MFIWVLSSLSFTLADKNQILLLAERMFYHRTHLQSVPDL